MRWVDWVVQTRLAGLSQNLLDELFREMVEDWVHGEVMKMAMFCSSMMIEVYKVFCTKREIFVFRNLFIFSLLVLTSMQYSAHSADAIRSTIVFVSVLVRKC